MQADRSANEARLAGSVRGLGVCDALRLELEPTQRADLAAVIVARIEAAERDRSEDDRELLRTLQRLRDELPMTDHRFTITGPTGIVLELVAAALHMVMRGAITEIDGDGRWSRIAGLDLLNAHAWLDTVLDCRAVERFSFDSDCDPTAAW